MFYDLKNGFSFASLDADLYIILSVNLRSKVMNLIQKVPVPIFHHFQHACFW
jgi:hypothetical protein